MHFKGKSVIPPISVNTLNFEDSGENTISEIFGIILKTVEAFSSIHDQHKEKEYSNYQICYN